LYRIASLSTDEINNKLCFFEAKTHEMGRKNKKNVFSFLLLASPAQLSKPLLFAASPMESSLAKLKTWFTFFGENALFAYN
jgi:hypothetical protein